MSLALIGLSHKTAPVEVRERFAVPEAVAREWAGAMAKLPGLEEALILSTCNRVEFLVRSDTAPDPAESIFAFLAERHAEPLDEARSFFYQYADREAIEHLFRVAASLDSMVVGEPQILGQVKDAYVAAKEVGAVRGPLDQLLSAAFRVARRVRTETGIGEMAVSVSSVAVELARRIFGELDGMGVLIIGAGEMSEATAQHLKGAGADRIFVTNRTLERAEKLATKFGGEAVAYDRLLELLTRVDIVISSTGAPGYILDKPTAEGVIAARRNRPIFLVDIAVPRDMDPAINEIDNIFLYDIDDLQQVADGNLRARRKEAEEAERIVREEVDKMVHRLKTLEVAPTIVSLHGELERLRISEIERFRAKLGNLTPEQQTAVDGLTRSLMKKVAHPPVAEMKKLASHPDGMRFVEFVRRAFNLTRE